MKLKAYIMVKIVAAMEQGFSTAQAFQPIVEVIERADALTCAILSTCGHDDTTETNL